LPVESSRTHFLNDVGNLEGNRTQPKAPA